MNIKVLSATLIAASLSIFQASAIPAKLGTRTVTQPDGSTLNIKVVGDERLHFTTTEDGLLLQLDEDGFYRLAKMENGLLVATSFNPVRTDAGSLGIRLSDIDVETLRAKKTGMKKAAQSGMGLSTMSYPNLGHPRGLIILVEYSDVSFTKAANYDAKEYFNDMINGDNFTQFKGTGSAKQYFSDQSKGKFVPQFDVYGPVKLPNKREYYGRNDLYGDDAKAHEMVSDAIAILDNEVDFSVYDNDKDGIIDNVYVFYAGQGEADYGSSYTVWPHNWDVRAGGINMKVDGVTVAQYACSNEWGASTPCGVGTFIHEFSHVMGLPDLYHTSSSYADYTPLSYSVLDYGPYNNDSRTPPNYSAYEKNAMRWTEPLVLGDAATVELREISTGDVALIPTSKEREFFLLENRQLTGWDKYLPNHGMLIWHIDYTKPSVFEQNVVNNTEKHQYVDIVEAGNKTGRKYLERYTYPGTSGKTEFTAESTPALQEWSGAKIDIPITNIKEENGIISFDVCGGGDLIKPEPDSIFTAEVEAIETVDIEDIQPEYYTLQGLKIQHPSQGEIVIEKRGDKVRKIRF